VELLNDFQTDRAASSASELSSQGLGLRDQVQKAIQEAGQGQFRDCYVGGDFVLCD